MLPAKWMVFILMFSVLSALVCAICEGGWIGVEEQTTIERLLECKVFSAESLDGKIQGLFHPELYTALYDTVSFNYAIFYGTWELVRWLLLVPLTIMVISTVVLQTAKILRGV